MHLNFLAFWAQSNPPSDRTGGSNSHQYGIDAGPGGDVDLENSPQNQPEAVGKEKYRIHDGVYHDVAVQTNRVAAQEPYNQEDKQDQGKIEPGLDLELKDHP